VAVIYEVMIQFSPAFNHHSSQSRDDNAVASSIEASVVARTGLQRLPEWESLTSWHALGTFLNFRRYNGLQ